MRERSLSVREISLSRKEVPLSQREISSMASQGKERAVSGCEPLHRPGCEHLKQRSGLASHSGCRSGGAFRPCRTWQRLLAPHEPLAILAGSLAEARALFRQILRSPAVVHPDVFGDLLHLCRRLRSNIPVRAIPRLRFPCFARRDSFLTERESLSVRERFLFL